MTINNSISDRDFMIRIRSIRSISVDVWDGPNGEPIICHGYTLTSKILAKDVIVAIKSYAFCSSM